MELQEEEEMELPKRYASAKAELNQTIFIEALHESDEQSATEKRDEQVSLESAYRRFLKSPHVATYYKLVPLATMVLDSAKKVCVAQNITMAKSFDTLVRRTQHTALLYQNKDALRQATNEINQALNALHREIIEILKDTMNNVEIPKKDAKMLVDVVSLYWRTKSDEYFERNTGLERLTKAYVLQNLLGFNVDGEKRVEVYLEEWRLAVWEYLCDMDRENMQLIATLDETQRELDVLYLSMQNQISYKSLVMLAMWRYRHNHNGKTSKSIVELIRGTECEASEEEIGWTLAYGEFFKDYQLFMMWHRYDFEHRPVHIHLYYIDFKASAMSSAIPIDMKSEQVSSATPFASIFVNHNAYLPLSYMLPYSSNERKQ